MLNIIFLFLSLIFKINIILKITNLYFFPLDLINFNGLTPLRYHPLYLDMPKLKPTPSLVIIGD